MLSLVIVLLLIGSICSGRFCKQGTILRLMAYPLTIMTLKGISALALVMPFLKAFEASGLSFQHQLSLFEIGINGFTVSSVLGLPGFTFPCHLYPTLFFLTLNFLCGLYRNLGYFHTLVGMAINELKRVKVRYSLGVSYCSLCFRCSLRLQVSLQYSMPSYHRCI